MKECVQMDLPLHKTLVANLLRMVSQSCDKKAEIEFEGKKYVVREIIKKGLGNGGN